MPQKNSIKNYSAGGFYHLYNRGIRGVGIFNDEHDYASFLFQLKRYLDPEFREARFNAKTGETIYMVPNYVYKDVELLAYCFMPTHFHLIVRNITEIGSTMLMRRVISNYVTYFNEKAGLSGGLFDGIYRCVQVTTEEQLLHLSRYIHLNPSKLVASLESYSYSSYPFYTGAKNMHWIKSDYVLEYFSQTSYSNSYREFVEAYKATDNEQALIKSLLLD
ncbi:transposase [Patescibacteria group bacterium]|nr:transposase [Patescibacteria group bacterium]MBU1868244.1 transposase [Patescibacteria group bacterium]